MAASFAADGFRGAGQALEGKAGFLHAYAPNADHQAAVADLGEKFETMDIAVKPYPSCRYGHAAMDALIELRAANDIDYQDIESVEVGLPRTGWNLIGDPENDKQNPKNYVDGQFSMPFVAAVAIRDGKMGWDSYAPHLKGRRYAGLVQANSQHRGSEGRSRVPRPHGRPGAGAHGQRQIREDGGHRQRRAREFSQRRRDARQVRRSDQPLSERDRRDALAGALLRLDECTDMRGLLALTRSPRDTHLRAAGSDD